MSIELSPVELGFRRPLTHQVTQVLRLRNPGYSPVAFKVKTTAPKQYCVRPNSGRIEAGHIIEVQVILQAMKEDPPLDAKCRDKFLVQSVAISPDKETANLAQLWAYVEQSARASIQERKIRVSYLPPANADSHLTPVSKMNGARDATPNSDPPPYSTPTSAAKIKGGDSDTPSRSTHAVAPVGPVSVPASRPAGNHHLGEAKASAFNPAMTNDDVNDVGEAKATDYHHAAEHDEKQSTTGKLSSSMAHLKETVPTSTEELKAALAEAQAKIARLTSRGARDDEGEGEGGTMRQRKFTEQAGAMKDSVAGSLKNMAPSQEKQQQIVRSAGVAVPVVAVLCLLSFLVAYVFF